LVENPNSQDQFDILTLRYRAVLLKKPAAVAPEAELHKSDSSDKSRAGSPLDTRAACRAWLMGLMRRSQKVRPKPKPAYQQEALEKWPELTIKDFIKSWEEAIEETGATVWAKAGRPRGTTKKSK
jgi:hypothetical protein